MPVIIDGPPTELEKYDTQPASNLIYTEESLLHYKPGGFHPVHLGDTFRDGRYEIVHKLGWGSFGMVWMARDSRDNKWVALKICRANVTDHRSEVSKLDTLRSSNASKYVSELLNHFTIQGPNGTHLCIVTEFLGPSINDVIYYYVEQCASDRMDADDVLRTSRLLLEATTALHAAGFAHGDLSASNVVFTTSFLRGSLKEDAFEVLGEPETAELVRRDGAPLRENLPKRLVEKACWTGWCHEDEEDLRFVDVAQMFPLSSPPSYLPQPCDLRAPETILDTVFDHRNDLWRLGCIIFLLVFHGNPISSWGDDADFVQDLVGFNDPLPDEWRAKYEEIQNAGCPRKPWRSPDDGPWLAELFKERTQKGAELEDLAPLQPIVAGLMRMRPRDRLSARAALQMLKDTVDLSSDISSDDSSDDSSDCSSDESSDGSSDNTSDEGGDDRSLLKDITTTGPVSNST